MDGTYDFKLRGKDDAYENSSISHDAEVKTEQQ